MTAEPTLWDLLSHAFRRYWLLIGLTSFVGAAFAATIAMLLTPVYSAETVLLFDQSSFDPNSDARSTDDPNLQKQTWLANSQLAVLGSTGLANRVLSDPEIRQSLEQDPLFVDTSTPFEDASAYLRNLAVSIASILGLAIPEGDDNTDEYHLTRAYLKHLDIRHDQETYVLRVAFEASSPVLAARIANLHAQYYVEMLRNTKVEVLDKGTSWLSQEVAEQRNRLIDAEKALKTLRDRTGIVDVDVRHHQSSVDIESQTSADVHLGEMSASAATAEAELAALEARQRDLARLMRQGRIEEIADMFGSTLLQKLRERFADVSAKAADYSQEMGPKHPAVQGVSSQKKDLEAEINNEVRRIARGLQGEVDVARGKVQTLATETAELERKSLAAEPDRAEFRRLKQEVEAERTRYDSVMQKQRAYERKKDLAQAGAVVTSYALPPFKPNWPNKPLFVIFGLCFAGGITLIGMSWRLATSDVVRTAEDINQQIEAPCIASLPEVPTTTSGELDRTCPEYACYLEGLRVISANLAVGWNHLSHYCRVLLVASPLPDEGKTTFCEEFGRTAAESGLHCLIVSTDPLNKENVEANLSAAKSLVPVRIAISNKLKGSSFPIGDFLSQLSDWRRLYDLVIIDTPPVSASSEALLLASAADATLILVRLERTPISLLKTMTTHFAKVGGHVMGIVAVFAHLQTRRGITRADFAYYFMKNKKYYNMVTHKSD